MNATLTADLPLRSSLTPVTMPDWGAMMEAGTVAVWRVKEGEVVEVGGEIAEVETSKLCNSVEAPTSGTVLRIICEPGRPKRVGCLLAIIGPPDVDPSEIDDLVEEYDALAAEADRPQTQPKRGVVQVGAQRIAYAERGVGGPPIVLIHGFGADQNTWKFTMDALADGRRTISLDLPGHGASTAVVSRGDLVELAENVGAALDELGAGRALFVGHGLGAAVALQLVLSHPKKVTGLAAISGFGFGGDAAWDVAGLTAADRRRALADLSSPRCTAAYPRSLPALEAIAAASLAPCVAIALRQAMADVDIPILALHGELDRVIAPPASLPPNVSSARIPGVGHMVHMEAAAQVNELIASFAAEIA